jgi:hypothetical protein
MKLALEIPTTYLPDWSPLTDMDFALAHKVLEDEQYAKWYASRPRERKLILDNSMHELGSPMPPGDLQEAARRCRADYVVPPDKLGDPVFNFESYLQTRRLLGGEFGTAVAMSGRDAQERAVYLQNVRGAEMLCLPYREPRLAWYREQKYAMLQLFDHIHLFGVSTMEELKQFAIESTITRKVAWSVDTRKPIKWGVIGERMDRLATLRNKGGISPQEHDLFFHHRNLNCAQTECCLWNIAYLRGAMCI